MRNETAIKIKVAECVASLYEAVQASGGIARPDLLKTPLGEVIADVFGQNGIRFVYEKPGSERGQQTVVLRCDSCERTYTNCIESQLGETCSNCEEGRLRKVEEVGLEGGK